MPNGNLVIRQMTRDEVGLALDWAAADGWNPGLHDADVFYWPHPQGFFICLLDGVPVGCIAAVAYSTSFGFMGLHIVRPEFRGKGFGHRLWNAGMRYLNDRNIGLDGVIEQEGAYMKSGFRHAYRNIRYRGSGVGKPRPGVVPLADVPFEALAQYDDHLFPAPRHEFLRRWVNQPGSVALGILKGGHLAGYGVLRACRTGFKIGPLFADEETLAEELLHALFGSVHLGDPVFLDAPAANPAAVTMAKDHAMQPVEETVRMYTKKEPDIPLNRWFGVTSLELG